MMNHEEMRKQKEDRVEPAENQAAESQTLQALQGLKGVLTPQEELVFMNILFSSSATLRGGNFGLSRKEAEKQLGTASDNDALDSYIIRVNQAVGRYFKLIYDDRRDQLIVMMRVPARTARTTLSEESLALLLYIFYQQEVLQHEYTLFDQLLHALGHETTKANQKLLNNLDALKKIGAIEEYSDNEFSNERAYQLTAIGANLFSDSFLRRTAEFSQSNQLSKEEVLKFFRRYNLHTGGE